MFIEQIQHVHTLGGKKKNPPIGLEKRITFMFSARSVAFERPARSGFEPAETKAHDH